MSFALIGTLYGLFIGIIPSSGSNKALVLLFSIATYFWGMPYEFVAFSMAAAISCTIGDSFAGVYIGVPGANSAAATMVDGFPLALKGKATYAISAAVTTSTINGLLWGSLVFFLLPWYTQLLMIFCVPELWGFMILALATVGFVSSNLWIRSLVAIAVGISSQIDQAYAIGAVKTAEQRNAENTSPGTT